MSAVIEPARKDSTRMDRADPSALARWFWEIDRVLLLLVAVLIAIGLIAVAAASPAAAVRYSNASHTVAPLYYFSRQMMWIVIAAPVMILVSMASRQLARRAAIGLTALFIVMLVLVPFFGNEVNGARRWIGFGFAQFQPSEFLKPVFIVTVAWILSLREQDAKLPVVPLTAGLTLLVAGLLMMQPNLGETVIFLAAWAILLMLAGVRMRYLVGLALVGVAALVLAYFFYDVATIRIDAFLSGGSDPDADTFQTDSALKTLTSGGPFGTGPGGGIRKFGLPEPHTDYIFSVIGEEFGLVACLAIAILYLAIVARVLIRLLDEEDGFVVLAAAGLVCQFGLQALINMAVNVQLAPSKGMTLPFISYGGSSMLALSIGMGLLLAFTRRNPYLHRSTYTNWSGR